MIDERREEQACAYVVGALAPDEARQFETALAADDELRQLTDELFASTKVLAAALPAQEPSADLKRQIMRRIAAREADTEIIRLPQPPQRGWYTWLPWAAAACLVGLCAALSRENSALKAQLVSLQAEAQKTHDDYARVSEQATLLAGEVDRLQSQNRLAEVRISMLNSLLADAPKTFAVSLWDQRQQSGVFVVRNLKPLPADKDYQLWVIDAKAPAPVDAGVFQVDKDGNVRIEFKPKALIKLPDKFAVTEEPKGGRPTPTMDHMVLLGT